MDIVRVYVFSVHTYGYSTYCLAPGAHRQRCTTLLSDAPTVAETVIKIRVASSGLGAGSRAYSY